MADQLFEAHTRLWPADMIALCQRRGLTHWFASRRCAGSCTGDLCIRHDPQPATPGERDRGDWVLTVFDGHYARGVRCQDAEQIDAVLSEYPACLRIGWQPPWSRPGAAK